MQCDIWNLCCLKQKMGCIPIIPKRILYIFAYFSKVQYSNEQSTHLKSVPSANSCTGVKVKCLFNMPSRTTVSALPVLTGPVKKKPIKHCKVLITKQHIARFRIYAYVAEYKDLVADLRNDGNTIKFGTQKLVEEVLSPNV